MLLWLCSTGLAMAQAKVQESNTKKLTKATRKIEKGFYRNDTDTLAQGYFDLGETYYQKNDLVKSESYYQQSKKLFEQTKNAEGIAKSSRALAKVQEDLNKKKDAIDNYYDAQANSEKSGDKNASILNSNDITRLSKPDSLAVQRKVLQENIALNLRANDTLEIVNNFERMAEIGLKSKSISTNSLEAFKNAYRFSKTVPEQAVKFNQLITDEYLKEKNFSKAIESKKGILQESFVLNSTQLQASEITSLADIYILKNEDSTAVRLLNESYQLSVRNGHTLEAKKCIEKLDSIFQSNGRREKSLSLYKNFLTALPGIISKDSSLTDNKIIQETETKLKQLEIEKAFKDGLIKRKNILNYWLFASVGILLIFLAVILFIIKKLQVKNKKIALQSLRREMNPHFIFNSLNSINQFIANNNELEANQYLTRFSTLMRRVMENSKEDFVLFSKETELLQNYLELEKSRFPDKFSFDINIDDELYADEHLYIPGMLIQPHLENAIWHGLRYIDEKGLLQLNFTKKNSSIEIMIEDNGIGIAESKKTKTAHQQKHSGRGIKNTLERIKILNELYHQHITCIVEDKTGVESGVRVKLTVPLLKNYKA